jgi:hypothetical protein
VIGISTQVICVDELVDVQRTTVETVPAAATCGNVVDGVAVDATARFPRNLGTIRRFSPGHHAGSVLDATTAFGVAPLRVQSVNANGYGPGGTPGYFSPLVE